MSYTTRLNDPGLIGRNSIYSSLSRSEKSKTLERTLRRYCRPHPPTPYSAAKFLESYNAFYTSYHTEDTRSYSSQFIFFFTPTAYTELAIIGERLANLIEDSRELAGGNMKELDHLEVEKNRIFNKRDALLHTFQDDPTLIHTAPSLVLLFEQMYASNSPESYNFIGVFQGIYRHLCHITT